MTLTPIEELILKYKTEAATYTERQKAELERDIWELVPHAERSEISRDIWFFKNVDVPKNPGNHRSTLINALPASEPLWAKIEEGVMPKYTAIRILKTAKDRTRAFGITRSEAVLQCLAEYEQMPGYTTKLSDGRIVRRRNPSSLPNLKSIPLIGSLPKSKRKDGRDKNVWVSIRKEVSMLVASKLRNTDPILAERLWKEFEVDLKVLITDFQGKISKSVSKERRSILIASESTVRGRILWACEALSMDPPAVGAKVDLERANKQKKKLAHLYHPDSQGGSDSTTEKYREVMQAYEILEAFNDRFLSVVPKEEDSPDGNGNSEERDVHD